MIKNIVFDIGNVLTIYNARTSAQYSKAVH